MEPVHDSNDHSRIIWTGIAILPQKIVQQIWPLLFSIIIVNFNVMVFVMYTFFFKVFNTPALFTCFTQCLFCLCLCLESRRCHLLTFRRHYECVEKRLISSTRPTQVINTQEGSFYITSPVNKNIWGKKPRYNRQLFQSFPKIPIKSTEEKIQVG